MSRAPGTSGFVVKRFAFAVPGDLAIPTGGYAYDRRMMAELGDLGWRIDLLDLGEGFPWPNEATLTARGLGCSRCPPADGSSSMDWRLVFCRKPRHSLPPQSVTGAGASSAGAGMGIVRQAGRRVTRE